jgi:hypothetical protein
MYPHHQQTIDRLAAHFRDDPRYLALIIGGSVAKGWAAPNSDVDFLLIASDDEYTRRTALGDHSFFSRDFTDYPDGYVDGKIIDMTFLRDVADHGSEPARAAFVKAFAAYSHLPEIAALLDRIPVYPETEREARMRSFYSQVLLVGWFVGEGEKRQNRYLLARMSADLVLYGGRLILAYNRILYPYHKWFLREVERAAEKPEDFMQLAQAVVEQPGTETASRFIEAISSYRDWGVTFSEAVSLFMKDREWNWRSGTPPLEDC